MHPRYRGVLPLAAACLALSVAPAFAAKPDPTTLPRPTAPAGEPHAGSAICQLGVLGPPANAYGYILPPDDAYYTLLNPATCDQCPPGQTWRANVAHMQLYFTEPCQIPVTVRIVAAQDLGGGCLAPNVSAPLCPPRTYTISDGGVLNECVDYTLALDPTCCFNGPVFLMIEFDQGSCANGRPAFCGPATCRDCVQYNFYPGVNPPGDDLCVVLAPFGLTGNIMYADIECCTTTPTLPGTWGRLKTLYR